MGAAMRMSPRFRQPLKTSAIPKTKVYLRRIPVDPMTGKADWVFRSCYDPSDSTLLGW